LPLSKAYAYDPDGDTWEKLPELPSPRGASAVVMVSGKVYVVGGCSQKLCSNDKEATPEEQAMLVFDPTDKSWSTSPQMSPRWLFGSSALGDRVGVYLGGGATSWAEVFDPTTQTWSASKKPRDSLDPGVYSLVSYGPDMYMLVIADTISGGGLSASGKLWRYDSIADELSVVGQRGQSDGDALFLGDVLAEQIYFVGAFTHVKVENK
jgi:N-acetylneuraminic acid mutarotase